MRERDIFERISQKSVDGFWNVSAEKTKIEKKTKTEWQNPKFSVQRSAQIWKVEFNVVSVEFIINHQNIILFKIVQKNQSIEPKKKFPKFLFLF